MNKIININDFKENKVIDIIDKEHINISFIDKSSQDQNYCLEINLKWDNSSVIINWRIQSKKNEIKKYKVKINFYWNNQKWILDLRWTAEWNSKIIFEWTWVLLKNSRQSNIKINENILLLSDRAIGQALPILRVETDNIKEASHSASISPIEESIKYYLASRWINEKKITNIIKKSFLRINNE